MQTHHFISYSSVDGRAFAQRLHEALVSQTPQVRSWLDNRSLRPGEDWDDQVVEALRDSRSLLFVMTPDSVDRFSQCKREWSLALKYKVPVVVLRTDRDTEPPFRLLDHHYLNFANDFDAGLQALVKYLAWMDSPAGLLRQLEIRRLSASRDLRRAADGLQRSRIDDEITLLEKQIRDQRIVVDNPRSAADRVEASITSRMAVERTSSTAPVASRKTVFINPPPGLAPSYFQDRLFETGLIADFLQDDALRMVGLVGRGGVGKTALVCRLLRHLEDGQLPDDAGPLEVSGIVYLSSVGSRRITATNLFSDLCKLLPDATAAELDRHWRNPAGSVTSKMTALLTHFGQGRTVVLLDNLEDVLEGNSRHISDSELFECLRALLTLPHHCIKTIFTSRVLPADLSVVEPARLRRVFLDEGLESPYAENILREMDVDGRLGLRNASAETLLQARHRTRGFPRALEALFAILSADRDTTLEELLAEPIELPENVVEVLVGEAFERLDPGAKAIMQALAVFGRPVTAVAVDYLLKPLVPTIDSASTLSRLVNMQFVRKESNRYFLHPVDAAYAIGKVPQGDPEAAGHSAVWTRAHLWKRAADYFREIRLPREEWRQLPDIEPQLAEIELRTAAGDFDTAGHVLESISFNYLYAWGEYRLMVDLHTKLLDLIREPVTKQSNFGNLGTAYRVLGQLPKAFEYTDKALQLATSRSDLPNKAVWLGNKANCHQDVGQTQEALQCHRRALEIKRRLGDRMAEGINLASLGNCHADLGDMPLAQQYQEDALVMFRRFHQRDYEALTLSNLADILIDQDRFADAIGHAKLGFSIGTSLSSPMACVYCCDSLTRAHLRSGDLIAARKWAEAAIRYDVPEVKDRSFMLVGLVATVDGRESVARDAFVTAIGAADEILQFSRSSFLSLHVKALALAGLCLHGDSAAMSGCLEAISAARRITIDAGIVRRVVRLLDILSLVDKSNVLAPARAAASGSPPS